MASSALVRNPIGGVSRPILGTLFALLLMGLIYVRSAGAEYITTYFLIEQDLPALGVIVVLALALRFALASPNLAARLNGMMTAMERVPVWAMAAFVAVAGFVGAALVFDHYPLSMDEFWARADGQIFAHGVPMAHVPAQWLPYASALQPVFLQLLPKAGLWASRYLPVNALIQLALGPLASPLLAMASVFLVAAIARRLMPKHRGAPVICALLFVSSSQFLITAMTPYAMTAHLAFNLGWLWLFLRRSAAAQVTAIVVGFLATGLHQLVFFPLFALPFVAESFLSGRRGWAMAHGLAIAAGVLAWSNYDSFAAAMMGVSPEPGVARNAGSAVGRAMAGLLGFNLQTICLMAVNLLRFQLWQNALAVPLAIFAALQARRLTGPLQAAAAGIVLVVMVIAFVQPFQGHGWGYRYLHDELGSVALLATYGWYRIAEPQRAWRPAFAAMLAMSVAVLFPLHAYQAWRQAAPYVAADRALKGIEADVIVIDAPHHAYSWDLARNSPLLDNRPKRMAGFMLDGQQLAQLCQRYRVRFFTDDYASRFGIIGFPARPGERVAMQACPA